MKLKIILFIFVVILLIIGIFYSFYGPNNIEYESFEIDSNRVEVPTKTIFGLNRNEFIIEKEKVSANQTLGIILNNAGVSNQNIEKIVTAADGVFNVRSIRLGNSYYLFYTKDSLKSLQYFVYQIDKINYVRFDLLDSIIVSRDKRKVDSDTIISSGVVSSSLWNTMRDANADPMLALYMSDIYAWTIDFYGLQKGDSFTVLYTTNSIDSSIVGVDKILASRFTHAGKNHYAYYFIQDSIGDYFDELGGSLRRAYLKAPLKFSRISSKFSNSRLHPILKIRRPHHGVDYAAPKGTPVMTIGDGKVISMSWDGGYGRRVVVKHNGNHKTGYAHLSAYGKGIKTGSYVKQGDIIGYVGSSGVSTGAHLDFRFYVNEKPVDPLKVESPPAVPIKDSNRSKYNLQMRGYMQAIDG